MEEEGLGTEGREATMCTGKARYLTSAAAAKQARYIARKLRVYRCPYCHAWHLGNHKDGGKRRSRA